MQSVQKFHTGLIPLEKPLNPGPPYNGSRWSAKIEKRIMNASGLKENEIVIYAKSWFTAQNALDLIASSLNLFTGEYFLERLIAYNDSESKSIDYHERIRISSQYFKTAGFPMACAIAAKASRIRKFAYAIAKYSFSISLYSVPMVDLEPHRSPHLCISSLYHNNIKLAYAIIASYSVIEELGFNVPASREKPSMINGKWNPVVKSELENKLKGEKINLNEKLLWTVRGPRRKIERKKPPQLSYKAPWSLGQVRDADIEVVDAINYASWIRSHVASHKLRDLVSSLSPYDVINVQHLARRLTLESLGFWRFT